MLKINNRYNLNDNIIFKKTKEFGKIIEIRKYLYSDDFNVILSYRYDNEYNDIIEKSFEEIYKNNFFINYSYKDQKVKTLSFAKNEIKYIIKIDETEVLVNEKDIKPSK